MPSLSRRRYPERADCWHIHDGDVHVGSISIRAGVPPDGDPWEWRCGFYPGSHPGDHLSGTATTFDQARAGFDTAGKVFLSKRTPADVQSWRDQRDWTERKYAMWTRRKIAVTKAKYADALPVRGAL
jgi:hypothetical protein